MVRGTAKCPKCGDRGRAEHSRKTWEDINKELKRRGLIPLFVHEDYKSVESVLRFKHTKCGNEFECRYRQAFKLKDGSACPKCNPLCKRGTLEECEKLAQKKGGICVKFSGNVKDISTWKCNAEHVWQAPLFLMRKGSWCMICEYDSRIKYKSEEDYKLAGRLASYKRRDKQKNRGFDIDFNDMLKLKDSKCFYCSDEAKGYDRKDNSLGHLKTNVVPCCFRCNKIKMDKIPFDLMIEIGKTINKYYAKNNKS